MLYIMSPLCDIINGLYILYLNNYILRDFVDELRTLPTPQAAKLPGL